MHRRKPSDVLCDLNSVLVTELTSDEDFCSVVFARITLDDGGLAVTLASAGHPVPMLVRSGGEVEEHGDPAPPAGLFDSIEPD